MEVDKLTHSIENVITGDSFETNVSALTKTELKSIKKAEWLYDWANEVQDEFKTVYKLTVAGNPGIIQGLISIEDRNDHIFMCLLETAKFNKGKNRVYVGVPGNLVAFACKLSDDMGYKGIVSFFAKTKLIGNYRETLGAKVLFGNQMIIDELSARKLIFQYFKQ